MVVACLLLFPRAGWKFVNTGGVSSSNLGHMGGVEYKKLLQNVGYIHDFALEPCHWFRGKRTVSECNPFLPKLDLPCGVRAHYTVFENMSPLRSRYSSRTYVVDTKWDFDFRCGRQYDNLSLTICMKVCLPRWYYKIRLLSKKTDTLAVT